VALPERFTLRENALLFLVARIEPDERFTLILKRL